MLQIHDTTAPLFAQPSTGSCPRYSKPTRKALRRWVSGHCAREGVPDAAGGLSALVRPRQPNGHPMVDRVNQSEEMDRRSSSDWRNKVWSGSHTLNRDVSSEPPQ